MASSDSVPSQTVVAHDLSLPETTKKQKPKSFPCPYCKGKGEWVEPVTDEGWGPTEYCGVCSSNGWIVVGSQDHRAVLHMALHRWLSERFVRKGDDWDGLDEWQPTWNAAGRLAAMAVDMLLAAKMEHYFGENSPAKVEIHDEAKAVLDAERELDSEREGRRSFRERVLGIATPHDNPAWMMAMADCYGGEYETKAKALIEARRGRR